MPARPDQSRPIALAVLHPNELLAKVEALANFFLDHRAAECLACCWAFLSQLIGRVLPEMSLDVILLLDACIVELVLLTSCTWPLLDACSVEPAVLCLFDLDACSVELAVLCLLVTSILGLVCVSLSLFLSLSLVYSCKARLVRD